MPNQKRERQRAARQAKRAAAEQARRRAQRRRQIIALAAAFLGILAIGFYISRDSGDGGSKVNTEPAAQPSAAQPSADQYGDAPCPPDDGAAERPPTFDSRPQKCIDDKVDYQAVFDTDAGEITVDLLEDAAPVAVNNFVFLARYKAYDGIPFHRVIPGFVVQGGDIENQGGTGGPGYAIDDELPKPSDYKEGSLAMANSGPDTSGSQFFIVVSDDGAQQLLDAVGGEAKYTLFGQVTSGIEVVKAIEADGTPGGTPTVQHLIRSVRIVQAKK
ncbi:MAG: peptidylprolyl isomerase [Acidimicrobiales bacterium]